MGKFASGGNAAISQELASFLSGSGVPYSTGAALAGFGKSFLRNGRCNCCSGVCGCGGYEIIACGSGNGTYIENAEQIFRLKY